jgi:inorganic pyrophosphatase
MRKRFGLLTLILFSWANTACRAAPPAAGGRAATAGGTAVTGATADPAAASATIAPIHGQPNFLTGHPATNPDGTVNAVIEIPAGTTAKWEVKPPGGRMEWDIEDGKPRIVDYLGYPANYGMVPRTVLSEAIGGDGDPLDVVVLGDAVPRGAVVPVKVIALIKLVDSGELDNKLIAVRADTPLYDVDDLSELESSYDGITDILQTWFLNYKGPGRMESQGFENAAAAKALLAEAVRAYEEEKADSTATP